ncbi:unannotated protein [freshwater metagenome]|uniref:Unannotated protein n=1 Tax=freshwater metagenome TaxID=449393 RepID=A0A6J6I3E5_9ZZZZ
MLKHQTNPRLPCASLAWRLFGTKTLPITTTTRCVKRRSSWSHCVLRAHRDHRYAPCPHDSAVVDPTCVAQFVHHSQQPANPCVVVGQLMAPSPAALCFSSTSAARWNRMRVHSFGSFMLALRAVNGWKLSLWVLASRVSRASFPAKTPTAHCVPRVNKFATGAAEHALAKRCDYSMINGAFVARHVVPLSSSCPTAGTVETQKFSQNRCLVFSVWPSELCGSTHSK